MLKDKMIKKIHRYENTHGLKTEWIAVEQELEEGEHYKWNVQRVVYKKDGTSYVDVETRFEVGFDGTVYISNYDNDCYYVRIYPPMFEILQEAVNFAKELEEKNGYYKK